MKLETEFEFANLSIQVIQKHNNVKSLHILKTPVSRNFIKAHIIGKSPIMAIPYIDRLSPHLSIHNNILYNRLLENINNYTETNKNLIKIQNILLLFEKILLNIFFLYRITKFYNMYWHRTHLIHHYEQLLRSLENITGRRYYPSLFLPYGINLNLSMGRIKTLRDLSFLLDNANFSLETLLKDLAPLDDKAKILVRSRIYATQNHIQNYIREINTAIDPISATLPKIEFNTGKAEDTLSSPRGVIHMQVEIRDNTIEDFKIKTPSELSIENLSQILKNTKIENIEENIVIQDISILEVIK